MMALSNQSHARPAPSVFFREFDGEMVLLDLARGEYYGLDEVGALIWAGVVKGRSADELSQDVADSYDVDRERALADTLRLLGDLEAQGLVVVD